MGTTAAVERPATRGTTAARRRRVVGLGIARGAPGDRRGAVAGRRGARAELPPRCGTGCSRRPDSDQRLTEIRLIVQTVRVPRTVLAIVAGVALGVGGALIQGYTRNPIADTGLLGVNSGASFAVVSVIAVFGFSDPFQYVWFAFLGAAVAGVVVFGLVEHRPGGRQPADARAGRAGDHGVPRGDDHGGRAVGPGVAERAAVLERGLRRRCRLRRHLAGDRVHRASGWCWP